SGRSPRRSPRTSCRCRRRDDACPRCRPSRPSRRRCVRRRGNSPVTGPRSARRGRGRGRSEEHTSELQSRFDLVCRLLLEKKNTKKKHKTPKQKKTRDEETTHQ